MDINLRAFDVNNLAVDPFIFGIFNIYVLPQIKLKMIVLAVHTLIKNNYNINNLSHTF